MKRLFIANFRKIGPIIYFFLLSIAATSFITIPSGNLKNDNWIPPDFNPKNVVLLIQEHPFGEKQNNRMIEFLEKEYHWRYEIVSIKQMRENKKYEDKKLYQFILLWTDEASPEITTQSRGFTYQDIDGNFLDRAAQITYPQSKLGKGFGQIGYRKVIKAINRKFKGDD
jgi:hypothetical protein